MSERIGDVTFGIGTETAGMEKAFRLMNQLSKATDQAARSTEDFASRTTSAYLRNEKAARRAFEETARLQRQMREFGAAPNLIGQSTRALNSYLTALNRSGSNTVAVARASDKFNSSMKNMQSAVAGLKPTPAMTKFNTVLRDIEASAVLAAGPLSGIGSRVRALGSIFERTTAATALMVAGFAGASVGLAALSINAVKTSMAIDKIKAGFEATKGGVAAANKEYDMAVDTVKRYGLGLQGTLTQYSQFIASTKNTAIEGAGARKVLEGMAVASRALSLSEEQVTGTMLAFTQMMSKGTVQAEELRGQVGERIPGAFRLAAEAMGVSQQQLGEMMKKGEVMAADLLPKLADHLINTFGDQALRNSDKLSANLARLSTNTFLFNDAFDKTFGISQKFNAGIKLANEGMEFLTKHMTDIKGMFIAATAAMAGFGAGFALVFGVNALSNVGKLTTAIVKFFSTMAKGQALIQALQGPKGWAVLAGSAAAVAAATIAINKYTDSLNDTQKATEEQAKSAQQFIDAQNKIQTASKETTEQYIEDVKKQIAAAKAQYAIMQMTAIETMDSQPDMAKNSPNSTLGKTWNDRINKQVEQANKARVAILQAEQQLADLNKLASTAKPEGSGGITGIEEGDVEKARKLRDALQPLNSTLARLKALKMGDAGLEAFERAEKVREFAEALEKAGANQELLNSATIQYGDALKNLDEAEKRYAKMNQLFDSNMDAVGDFVNSMRDSTTSIADDWNTMVNKMLKDWQDFVWQTYVTQPLKEAFQSMGGFSGIFDAIGGIFGGGGSGYDPSVSAPPPKPILPARAAGGRVVAGQAYMVGEQGPEPFVPSQSGRIIPHDAMGGGLTVIINNNGNSKVTARESNSSNGRSLEIMIDEAVGGLATNPASKTNRGLRDVMSSGIAGR